MQVGILEAGPLLICVLVEVSNDAATQAANRSPCPQQFKAVVLNQRRICLVSEDILLSQVGAIIGT